MSGKSPTPTPFPPQPPLHRDSASPTAKPIRQHSLTSQHQQPPTYAPALVSKSAAQEPALYTSLDPSEHYYSTQDYQHFTVNKDSSSDKDAAYTQLPKELEVQGPSDSEHLNYTNLVPLKYYKGYEPVKDVGYSHLQESPRWMAKERQRRKF